MKKLKGFLVIVVILSIVLSTNVLADEEIKTLNSESLLDCTSGRNQYFYVGTNDEMSERRIIFGLESKEDFENLTTTIKYEFDMTILQYDEFLYQIIPLNFEKSKEIFEFELNGENELKGKYDNIQKQIILAKKNNPTVTVEQVNNLIDEYNETIENKKQELFNKIPRYDENNWEKLEDITEITYTDTTGSTACILIYVKASYSDFTYDKTVYGSKIVSMNYGYFSSNQMQEEQTTQSQEQEQQEEPKEQQSQVEEHIEEPSSPVEEHTEEKEQLLQIEEKGEAIEEQQGQIEGQKEQRNQTEEQQEQTEEPKEQMLQTEGQSTQISSNDSTISNTKLPKTGKSINLVIIITLIVIISIILYKKYNYLKGI